MKIMAVRIILALALITGLSSFARAQVAGTTPTLSAPGTTPNAPNLQIVSPRNGQKLAVNFVNVRYQVTNPAAAVNNMPNFQVQLDGGDPVRTSSTDHTFTGLRPGEHTVTVYLVDANDTPILGTRTEVRFVVAPPQNAPAPGPDGGSAQAGSARLLNASLQQDTSQSATGASEQAGQQSQDDGSPLPSTGSAPPLLSVIGFGMLVGGIVSALRTR
ncbi:MAG TPA: LPXTG cell wall anchor domain-containing protein [Terriglobales bacterium]|nr:LPXTG cell wall anchor domain-containing protein [Terriglobales bacterium]